MITKKMLLTQLADAGLKHDDTVLVHSSMKKIGEVDGGAETVFQVLEEYFADGLLAFPTLTWKIGLGYPSAGNVYSVKDSFCDISLLPELFRHREGVVRSLLPTHSIAAKGRDAEEFCKVEPAAIKSSLPWDSPWGRLYEHKAKILFIGCTVQSCTYFHAIEEKANPEGLFQPDAKHVKIIDYDGNETEIDMYRHAGGNSKYYRLTESLLFAADALYMTTFGDAKTYVLDAQKGGDAVLKLLQANPQFFMDCYQQS